MRFLVSGRPGAMLPGMARAATDFTVSPLTGENWPALEDLFGPAGASNGCWCTYWRIGPRYKASAFARHGFEVVARRKPDRPVMRRILGPAS